MPGIQSGNKNESGFHPNINTATLELTGEMFRKYLGILDHEVKIIEL